MDLGDVVPVKESDRFSCQGCGTCCCKYIVPLTGVDIDRLQKIADIPFTKVSQFNDNTASVTISKRAWDNGCVFYNPETKRCSVHTNRPTACRLYPFAFVEVKHYDAPKNAIIVTINGQDFVFVRFKYCEHIGNKGNKPDVAQLVALYKKYLDEQAIDETTVSKK